MLITNYIFDYVFIYSMSYVKQDIKHCYYMDVSEGYKKLIFPGNFNIFKFLDRKFKVYVNELIFTILMF